MATTNDRFTVLVNGEVHGVFGTFANASHYASYARDFGKVLVRRSTAAEARAYCSVARQTYVWADHN